METITNSVKTLICLLKNVPVKKFTKKESKKKQNLGSTAEYKK